jgi:hypothetical protein
MSNPTNQGFWCLGEVRFYDPADAEISTSGGTAEASAGTHHVAVLGKAFDGVCAKKKQFCSSEAPSTSKPAWLMFTFATPTTVQRIELQTDPNTVDAVDPYDIQIQGSNDGSSWATFATKTELNHGQCATTSINLQVLQDNTTLIPASNSLAFNYGSLGGSNCPTGFTAITTMSACQDASAWLGIGWNGNSSANSSDFLPYCWVSADGNANFNGNGNTGSEAQTAMMQENGGGISVICKAQGQAHCGDDIAGYIKTVRPTCREDISNLSSAGAEDNLSAVAAQCNQLSRCRYFQWDPSGNDTRYFADCLPLGSQGPGDGAAISPSLDLYERCEALFGPTGIGIGHNYQAGACDTLYFNGQPYDNDVFTSRVFVLFE